MQSEKYVGRVVSFGIQGWKQRFDGIVVDYSDDWTLLKYNPVDYVIDGYVVLRNEFIKDYAHGPKARFKEKVLKRKRVDFKEAPLVPLRKLEDILEYLQEEFEIFQIYTKKEDECWLGRLKELTEKQLVIDYLSPEAKWEGKRKFKPAEIRVVEFETDYIHSLKLMIK